MDARRATRLPGATSATPSAAASKATAQKKPVQPTAPQKTQAQSQRQTIPAGATQVEPNLYRYTDSSGKTWNYRQTPFGISRWEETSTPAAQPTPAKPEPVVVTDLGDSYRFEKQTPFGKSSWVRKKSELTVEEKALTGGQPAPSTTAAAEPTAAKHEPVVVTDLGDSYRFEKQTPFGKSTWVRKKSELTSEEKALTAGQPAPSSSNQNSVNSKPAGNQ